MEKDLSPAQVLDFDIYPLLETAKLMQRGSGNNAKQLLIVSQTLAPDQRTAAITLLQKILQAVQMQLEEDAFFIELTEHEQFSFTALRQMLPARTLISFGIPFTRLGLHFQHRPYEIKEMADCRFLSVHPLVALSQDNQLKGALWKQLQVLFLQNNT